MLWYNRPSMVEVERGFVVAYATSAGDICVTLLSRGLKIISAVKLHHFSDVSDHSAPSIIVIPKGRFAGHILVFFRETLNKQSAESADR
jgi:hypothetical protein